ncbi:MAG: GGDEF domain-containing protein [Sorangiineae bacterium]|nr:GGDEF domain-containing protein [Polyangiaceae bacterium]MEB2322000.1 GGDEF domain-containing protein [Sorangiineae bacterium]
MGDHDLYETTVEVTITRDSTGAVRIVAPHQAYLVVISGPRVGQRAALGQEPLDIGRGTGCGLQLDADSVSRRHARIEWTGTTHRLLDLGSTNGTFVNEARISSRELRDGDRPQIGKVLCKYISGGNIEGAYLEEIQRLMRFDGLTGVHNKRHFDESLQAAMWQTRQSPRAVGLIVFDLDHFKAINDTHGHTAGDAVLRQVASVVSEQLSGEQLLARVGGEEFAVLCPGEGLERVRALAERIRGEVAARRFAFEELAIPVTVSLGCAERPAGSAERGVELYERADARLYAAKSAGRDCVR